MEHIKKNLQTIQEKIAKAAQKSGRTPEDITLVGVSKNVSPEYINEAVKLGVTHFGENRVQEFLTKYDNKYEITPTWHMIGHLQTNKVKFIIDKVKLIHSVDSLRLAQEIDKRAKKLNINFDVLIEINIAEEDTKQGILAQDALLLIEQIQQLSNISTKGLMCIAPYVEKSEQNRVYFEKMYRLYVDIGSRKLHNVDMRFLSMGMTGDFEVAVEEGANIVRVGTGMFENNSD